jgi:Cof subfamily protein (haloacid dehalogenase superfamily)
MNQAKRQTHPNSPKVFGDLRLLAVDLDGTLFDHEGNVSEANAKAIHETAERGIQVVPVSARPVFGMEYGLRAFDLFRYFIAFNGAYVYDRSTRQVLLDLQIEPEPLREILGLIKNLGLYAGYYVGNDFYADVNGESARMETRFLGRAPVILPDLLEVSGRGANKLIVLELNDVDKLTALYKDVNETVQGLHVSFSSRNSIEITPGSATKGDGLRFLADRLSIPREAIIAIGDHYNDISMLEYAGLAIAMSDSPAEVQQIADFVTTPCEGYGVAEAIDRFILHRSNPAK